MGATGRESLEPSLPRLHLDHGGDDIPVGGSGRLHQVLLMAEQDESRDLMNGLGKVGELSVGWRDGRANWSE